FTAANDATVDCTLQPSSYAFLICAALPSFTSSSLARAVTDFVNFSRDQLLFVTAFSTMSRPPNDRDLEFSRARWAYSQNNPVVVAHDPCRFESRIAMSMSSQSASVSAASLR